MIHVLLKIQYRDNYLEYLLQQCLMSSAGLFIMLRLWGEQLVVSRRQRQRRGRTEIRGVTHKPKHGRSDAISRWRIPQLFTTISLHVIFYPGSSIYFPQASFARKKRTVQIVLTLWLLCDHLWNWFRFKLSNSLNMCITSEAHFQFLIHSFIWSLKLCRYPLI